MASPTASLNLSGNISQFFLLGLSILFCLGLKENILPVKLRFFYKKIM